MKMTLVSMLMLVAGMAKAEDRTIWLQPGHCIIVGNQQVCATQSDDSKNPSKPANKRTHVCKDGIQDQADKNLKGWGHVIVTTNPDGKKLSEEVIKTYGPLGQEKCKAEMDSLR